MSRQLLNPTEEFAPHTNDPQRSVSVLFFLCLDMELFESQSNDDGTVLYCSDIRN